MAGDFCQLRLSRCAGTMRLALLCGLLLLAGEWDRCEAGEGAKLKVDPECPTLAWAALILGTLELQFLTSPLPAKTH